MNEIHIWQEEPIVKHGMVTASVWLGDEYKKKFHLWYRFPSQYKSALTSSCDPFVVATVMLAMRYATKLIVHGQVSPSLLQNLEEFQAAWTCWEPRYKQVEIIADEEKEQLPSSLAKGRAIAAFSGGLDSSFTVFRHRQGRCGRLQQQIEAGLLVHGFDISLNQPQWFEQATKSAKIMLDSIGMELIPMATNFRQLNLKWEDVHGCATIACLMLLQQSYEIGLVASTATYLSLLPPYYGSNPITDKYLSSNSFEIIHDGAKFTRFDKLQEIIDWDEALHNLRVCYKEGLGSNCGHCRKCTSTTLYFLALGKQPPCFPIIANLDEQILKWSEDENEIDSHTLVLGGLEKALQCAKNNKISDSWVTSLETSIQLIKEKLAQEEIAKLSSFTSKQLISQEDQSELMKSRKLQAYCVGTVKSGTHSIAGMFSRHYKAAHEPKGHRLIEQILALANGTIGHKELIEFVKDRDQRLLLEMDSSNLNLYLLDVLVQEFKNTKFILTLRDCYSWLDSFINHQLNFPVSKNWQKLRDYRYQYMGQPLQYAKEEKILAEYKLYTLDGYLSYWSAHNKKVIATVPKERLLIVPTDNISQEAGKIADFLNIPLDTLDLRKSHQFKALTKHDLLLKIDRQFLDLKVNTHCGELMREFFPHVQASSLKKVANNPIILTTKNAPISHQMSSSTQNQFQLKLEHLVSLITVKLEEIGDFDECVLLDSPDHPNIGDYLIWLGELYYLKHIKKAKIRYLANQQNYDDQQLKALPSHLPIFFQGGGNLGDLWIGYQDFKERIIARYPDRKIVIFPQSIFFRNQERLQQASHIFNAHPNLYIYTRDIDSFQVALTHFHACHVSMIPDMALLLKDVINELAEEASHLIPNHNEILFLKRKDQESAQLSTQLIEQLEEHSKTQLSISDWLTFESSEVVSKLSSHLVSLCSPNSKLYQTFLVEELRDPKQGIENALKRMIVAVGQLLSAKYIITDRLHGHILSLLLGLSHTLLPNSYHKNESFFKTWIRPLDGCKFSADFEIQDDLLALSQEVEHTNSLGFPQILRVPKSIQRPFWSVMIPICNRTQYLEQALKSVLTQAPDPTEMQIEVIDDGSTEEIYTQIVAIIKSIDHENRIRIYRSPFSSLGNVAQVFNLCIQRSQGHWVHILHDDDFVLDNFYAQLRQNIEQTSANVGAAFCRHYIADQSGQYQSRSIAERKTAGVLENWLERISQKCVLQHSSVVVRRDTYEQLGGYCQTIGGAADWEMWQRIAAHYAVWYEPQFLACYRQHQSSLSVGKVRDGQLIMEQLAAIEVANAYLPEQLASELSQKAKEHHGLWALSLAKDFLEEGDAKAAIANIRASLQCSRSNTVQEKIVDLFMAMMPVGNDFSPQKQNSQDLKNITLSSVDVLSDFNEVADPGDILHNREQIADSDDVIYTLDQLAELIQQYQKDFQALSALAELRQIRKDLAEQWLNLSPEQLGGNYLTGEMGRAHEMLLESGLKDEALTQSEQIFVRELSNQVAQGLRQPQAINYLIASTLYCYADQLDLNYEGAPIPNWYFINFLRYLLAPRTFFLAAGELDRYYRYTRRLVSYLHDRIFSQPDSPLWQAIAQFFLENANFLPLYSTDFNLKDILSQCGDIMEVALKNRGHQIDYHFSLRSSSRTKIRLGLIGYDLSNYYDSSYTLPLIENLDREKFEIILYTLVGNDNQLESYCEAYADQFVRLPKDIEQQVEKIRSNDLDILIFGKAIATFASVAQLGLFKLARVQIAGSNAISTTGMRNFDYYISGSLAATETNAQQYYREKQLPIKGTGLCYHYYAVPPEVANSEFEPTRSSWGANTQSVVFISGTNLLKTTPELRETWAQILAMIPNSILVLYPFNPHWRISYPTNAFIRGIRQDFIRYGVSQQRIVFLAPLPSRVEVKKCLQLADIYLDSYPYSGADSLFDALEVGLPTIVRQGNNARSNRGAAFLREIQLTDLIAKNEANYIQLTVALATDPQLRQRYRQQVQQKMQDHPSFLDASTYALQMEEILLHLD